MRNRLSSQKLSNILCGPFSTLLDFYEPPLVVRFLSLSFSVSTSLDSYCTKCNRPTSAGMVSKIIKQPQEKESSEISFALFLSHTFAAFVFVGFFLGAFQFYWHKVKIKMQLYFHRATVLSVLSACGNQLSSKIIDIQFFARSFKFRYASAALKVSIYNIDANVIWSHCCYKILICKSIRASSCSCSLFCKT